MLNRPIVWLKRFNQLHLLVGVGSVVFLAFVYFWKIGHLTTGMSPAEASTLANSHSLHALYHQPLNAPHNFLIYLILKTGHHQLWLLRSVSALWALIFSFSFYRITKTWFGAFIGWLSSLIFATVPLVILSAHSASADIMILSPLLLAACYFWLSRAQQASKFGLWAMVTATALCFYTPGAIWLIMLGLIAARRTVVNLAGQFGRWTWLAGLFFLLLIAPLGLGLAQSPRQFLDWLALPQTVHIIFLLKSIGWAFLALVWRSADHNILQIGRLAIVPLAQIALASLGLFALWQKARLKTYGLILVVSIGALLTGLSNIYSESLISLAGIGVLIAAGLRFLHIEWQGVFPRNPFARNFALTVIISAVGFSVFYGVRYSLVAWPHSLATKQTYVLK